MITTLEELSLNAWPALQTVIYDGWILRFANGYTKRANSVNPIYASTLDVDEKISCCESMYQDKNMPVVFKLTPAVDPSDLDEKLSASGYRKDSPTSVQVMDLGSVSAAIAREIKLQKDLSAEWLDNFCRMSAVTESNRASLMQILQNIIPQHCFAMLKFEDQVIACGLGVLQSGYIGLFDIVTDGDFRNCGYGQQVVKNILAWGKQNGAQKAYLQVVLDNASALHLYSKIGFTEMYRYWYRIKS